MDYVKGRGPNNKTSDDTIYKTINHAQALKEVPKSGEVWCEGARIHLNPLSKAFDLDTAGKYLGFAVQFTPQYGDSFMECLR